MYCEKCGQKLFEGSKICDKCNIRIINNTEPQIDLGFKCIVFSYCVSFLVLSQKRGSRVYIIKNKKELILKSLPYTLISLVFGWWGIPWGQYGQ